MIIRARALMTLNGPPVENGAVEVIGNRITRVGPWRDLAAKDAIDLGEQVLLPGLINAHCHLDYTNMRGAIPRQRSFTDWIREINERKASWTAEDYVESIERGFAEAMRFGTTSIVNFEAFPELIRRVTPAPLRTWWFAELIDVRRDVSVAEVVATLRSSCERFGLAAHASFTASRKLYVEAAQQNVPLSTHLAESRDEMEMFRDARGPLFDFMKSIGRPMEDCGEGTPIDLLLDVLNARWLVAHLNEITDDDIARLKNSPRFHVVHCPRSHAYFAHAPFRLSELRALGFNIALGTDSLASNDDLSLFAEMRAFRDAFPEVPPQDILAMVTVNAANALREKLGSIRSGHVADFVAIPFTGSAKNLADEIVAWSGPVAWIMMEGRPVALAS